MNILILGGTGFLGKQCSVYLAKNNDVLSINTRLCSYQEILRLIENHKADIVMHFVSTLIPVSDKNNFICDLDAVYKPTLHILEYCSVNNIKFVYISSGGAVYGNQHEIFTEQTKREPVSYYGLSKLNLENLVVYYHNTKNLNYMIIRPSNPYGPGQNIYGKQGLIAVLIGKIFSREKIEIWGDGSAVKDYIYIEDFAEYVTSLVEIDSAWNETFNIGSGTGISVNEILNAFKLNNIKLPEIKYTESKSTDVKNAVLNCQKLQSIVSKKCVPIRIGIKKFYEYELEKTK